MKYVKQFGIILFVAFLGEILNHLIPLPVPASIYGIILMFCALRFRVLKLEAVREVGRFLVAIMPMMFIPAAVGLMDAWSVLRPSLAAFSVITVVTTILVMAASGLATQTVIKLRSGKGERK